MSIWSSKCWIGRSEEVKTKDSSSFIKQLKCKSYEEEFWDLVDKKGENDCWLWKGRYCHSYGYFHKVIAHRVSYTIKNGEIPERMEICHRCDNPACVNPNHLYAGTHRDNMRDTIGKFKYLKKWGNKKDRCHKKVNGGICEVIKARYVEQQEAAEEMKCEMMRRSAGLIVSDDINDYDCTCCELRDKC